MLHIAFKETIKPATLRRIVAFLHSEKIRFEIQENEAEAIDWSGDFSTYQMATPVLARDWDAPSDAILDSL
jgi:hypothetical protein